MVGQTSWIDAVNLHVLPAGPIQTNAYLITNPERKEALLIDAPADIWPDIQPILSEEGCRLVEIWLTHGHWDHMEGGAAVVRATGAKVRAHPDDRMLIETPEIQEPFIRQLLGDEVKLEPLPVTFWLKAGDQLELLGASAEVRHVPGHCPGNVLFYFKGYGFAITGDVLLRGAVGRTDLPGGDFRQLAESIRTQIYTLPEDTVLLPGHGPKTTVGEEKATNPFVQG